MHAGTQALAAACPQQERERETTLIENANNPIWPRTSEQHCTNETTRATQRYHTNEQHKREQEQQIIQQQVPTSQQVASVHLPAVDAPSETAQMETPGHTKTSVVEAKSTVELYNSELQEVASERLDIVPATYEVVVESTEEAAPNFYFETSYDA